MPRHEEKRLKRLVLLVAPSSTAFITQGDDIQEISMSSTVEVSSHPKRNFPEAPDWRYARLKSPCCDGLGAA